MYDYCEYCNGPLKDKGNFFVLDDGEEDHYFCNEKELRGWLEDNPERAIDMIVNYSNLVDNVGW